MQGEVFLHYHRVNFALWREEICTPSGLHKSTACSIFGWQAMAGCSVLAFVTVWSRKVDTRPPLPGNSACRGRCIFGRGCCRQCAPGHSGRTTILLFAFTHARHFPSPPPGHSSFFWLSFSSRTTSASSPLSSSMSA